VLHCLRAAAGDTGHSPMRLAVNQVDHGYIAILLDTLLTWETVGSRHRGGPRLPEDDPALYRLASTPSMLRPTQDPIAESHRRTALSSVVCKLNSPYNASERPRSTAVQMLRRWALVTESFVQGFEHVQKIMGTRSFLHTLRKFQLKEKEFRTTLANLRSERTAGRVLKLEIDRKNKSGEAAPLWEQMCLALEAHALESLGNEEMAKDVPRLAITSAKMSFKDEIGEGAALLHSCLNDVAEALKGDPDLFVSNEAGSSETGGEKAAAAGAVAGGEGIISGKVGLHYNLVPTSDEGKLSQYRQVGRLIGLSLLLDCRLPIIFYRHVYKSFLGRPLTLSDLTYFDTESAKRYASYVEKVELFRRGLPGGEDPGEWGFSFDEDVTCDGVEIPVTATNFNSYIRWTAATMLSQPIQGPLAAINSGIKDVIPAEALDGLTPEDLQLLLAGRSGEIAVNDLRKHVTFGDVRCEESKANDTQTMERFEELVWAMLEGFTEQDRVDFVCFVLGTPVLDQNMEIQLSDPPATVGDGPFARQCAQYVTIPSYQDMTAELLAEVIKNAMAASIEYDTI
jgi:hypothetical protein